MNVTKIRKPIRELLAVSIWAHAIFATAIFGVPEVRWAALPSYAYDASLLIFIVFYSAICPSGWWSVLFDLLYAYLWPFIWLFRGFLALAKHLWKKADQHGVMPRSIKQIEVDTKKAMINNTVANPPKLIPKESFLRWAFRAVSQFSLLWCLIILNTRSKLLASIAICIALLGAVRATYNIWDFIADALDFIAKLKGGLSNQMANACKAILDWDQQSSNAEVKNAASTLEIFGKIFSFLAEKKSTVARMTTITAFVITIPFYLYISAIFACVYLGIAKVQHLPLDWKSAITDSLFIPIAFTDMPHGLLIRLIAGLHALAIGAMGYNVLFRHFNSKVEELAAAANELRQPLSGNLLQERLILITESATPSKPVSGQPPGSL